MKKTLTRAGAIGLAAATILTGLSFGPAAASAAPATPSAPASAAANAPSTVQLIFRNGSQYQTPTYTNRQFNDFSGKPAFEFIQSTSYGTLEAAEAAALSYTPRPTADGWYNLVLPSGQCAVTSSQSYNNPGSFLTTTGGSCEAADAKWKSVDGKLVNGQAPTEFVGRTYASTMYGPYVNYYYKNMIGFSASGYELAGDADALLPFSGHVEGYDRGARTADLEGYGVPRAQVLVDGEAAGEVSPEGTWSYTLLGLHLGTQTVALEQHKDGVKISDATVEVDLAVAPVTADVSFGSNPTTPATISGTAERGAAIEVLDSTGAQIMAASADPMTGAWSTTLPAPNAGGIQTYTVQQVIDSETNGPVTVTADFGAAVSIVTPVNDSEHDGGTLRFQGHGVIDGKVELRKDGESDTVGSTTVGTNGVWTIEGIVVSDQRATYTATQTGKGNNVTTSTVTLNPEADTVRPLTVETPENGSTVTTSRPVFTGHGQEGATVTIGYGATAIGTTTVVDGDWSITPTRGLGMGISDLTVTQDAGGVVSTLTHTLTRVAAELPLAVTSHVDGQTYTEGMTTFRGTAPVGSTVTATNQWGTPMGTATATDGTWSFNRNLGPTTAGYDLTFTATPPVGTPQTVSLKLLYAGNLAFQVTSPVNNSTYTVGTTTFTGTAAPGTTVTATNQWGTPMGRAGTALSTTWAFDRYLGPTSAGYDIAFVATKGTDTQRTALHLATAVVNVPVAVTSIADGATYRPGLNVLTGTGTPGATVEAVNATNGWNVPMGRATVKPDGTWALPERNWGPSNDYAVQVTQTNPDTTTSTTTVNVKAPVFAPLVLTRPAVGDTYDTGVAARFEGTATPFATVSVRSAKSDTTYRTVEADADGNWSFTRVWGPTHDYVLNIDQEARNGQSDSITGFAWNHSGK